MSWWAPLRRSERSWGAPETLLSELRAGTASPLVGLALNVRGRRNDLSYRGFRLVRLTVAIVWLVGCGRGSESAALRELGGDPARGVVALQHYSCASCHHIPGIVGATSWVGPPLGRMARRKYIAGVLPNTPDNMLRWLRNPLEFAPRSAMPDVGVSDQDARDIAAYLYSLD